MREMLARKADHMDEPMDDTIRIPWLGRLTMQPAIVERWHRCLAAIPGVEVGVGDDLVNCCTMRA